MAPNQTAATMPISYRGECFRSLKAYNLGTHRVRPPSETLAEIEPYMARAGVTRIADVTGLDNVGVPTTLAIRPNSPTMACSSGKGLTLAAAQVSGAMEAIELYAAETVQLPHIRATYRDLSLRYRTIPVRDLPLTRQTLFTEDWPFHWVLGWDLLTQDEIAVPLGAIEMSRSRALITDLGAFLASSNGLASGNTFLEAVAAALYEVIERDGIACHRSAWDTGTLSTPTLPTTQLRSYPQVCHVLDLCDAAAVDVTVYDCTVDTNVPTYDAYVYCRTDEGLGVFHGSGAHLDPEVAVLRAITEALQGRLNYIAGSRDDIFRAAFWRARRGSAQFGAALRRDAKAGPHAELHLSSATGSFEEDIAEIMRRLQLANLHHVIVVDITPQNFPIYVVRVLVPGCEGYMHHGYRRGWRALRYGGVVQR
jgi:ribosomal protein S12 methylthiotransferase accessory factor